MSISEEQAWLVRARSDSETSAKATFGTIGNMTYAEDRLHSEGSGEPGGTTVNMAVVPPENNGENESGELLDYNDSSLLEQFHEDALRQIGCGLAQVRVLLACAFALVGASLELSAIPFILPSAEIELCILPHEKNWLVLISLVGSSLGAVGWGALASWLGRRRALLSCLAVNAVFATIAAFMPTYGTFMMARFCSALGSGGTVPLALTYACEAAGRRGAARVCGAGAAWGGAGALLAALLAAALLPATGPTTLTENREHFSAWHRYLLLCTLPIISSLISLIWTQESPRYLLDVGREVDAMSVYQTMHSSNQFRICGKTSGVAVEGEYRLGELSLPTKRRPQPLHHVRHSVKMFWLAFYQLFSNTYRRTTLSYGGVLVFIMAMQFYLSSFIPTTVSKMENELFEASKQIINNTTYENVYANTTQENIEYNNVTFIKCVYKDLLMSHVVYNNCTFYEVSFSNVKSSRTNFYGCTFVNSTIIDTDMEIGAEFDAQCVFVSSPVRGIKGGCARHADLNTKLDGIVTEQTYVGYATLVASVILLLPQKLRPHALLCGACVVLSPSLYFIQSETALYILEASYRVLTTVIYFGVASVVITAYPANLRCTALGLMVCISFALGACVRCLFGSPLVSATLCAILSAVATLAATKHKQ